MIIMYLYKSGIRWCVVCICIYFMELNIKKNTEKKVKQQTIKMSKLLSSN